MSNRKRPYAYTFRATEQERNIIDGKIKASGLTMTEFVIKAITGKSIFVFEGAGEMLNELKRQGNNLNQAVRSGYYDRATEQELLTCVTELKKTYTAITSAVGGA